MSDDASGARKPKSSSGEAGERADALALGSAARPGPQLRREDMPTSFDISIVGSGGLDRILFGGPRERRHSMRGFEDTYVDIVDYIVRITHRIWEEKDFGYIYDTYRDGVHVVGSSGVKAGRDEILAESVAYSNAFPDLRLQAEEVIWAGDDERGFHTSHRLSEVGRNTGWAEWGAPTGRTTKHWVVANCVVSENQIFEEWVLDNTVALFQSLGLDARRLARESARELDREGLLQVGGGEIDRLQGQGTPLVLEAPAEFDPDLTVRYALHTLWNWRNLGVARRFYASTVRFHGASHREGYGRGDIQAYASEMLAMFPDLAFHVDEIYWQGNADDGYLICVRWTTVGTHLGWGPYGRPSGRRASWWGISQLAVRRGEVLEEWTMFNEFELLQQVLLTDDDAS